LQGKLLQCVTESRLEFYFVQRCAQCCTSKNIARQLLLHSAILYKTHWLLCYFRFVYIRCKHFHTFKYLCDLRVTFYYFFDKCYLMLARNIRNIISVAFYKIHRSFCRPFLFSLPFISSFPSLCPEGPLPGLSEIA